MKMSKGGVFIISGPSGSGKDALLTRLFKKCPDIKFSISSVTRNMREGEIEGQKYNFISREKFESMIENDELLEYNLYVDNYYGTPRKPVEQAVSENKDIFIEVDVNGAKSIREKLPEAVQEAIDAAKDNGFTAISLAMLCTVGAAYFACYKELRSTPAALMRPPVPKQGTRVFLEYFPFIWSKMNFSTKATVRNLVRYKKRFFMTVFGIGGCMAILLACFGLRDSISVIANKQYQYIWTYSAALGMDEDIPREEQQAFLDSLIAQNEDVESGLFGRYVSVDVSPEGAKILGIKGGE